MQHLAKLSAVRLSTFHRSGPVKMLRVWRCGRLPRCLALPIVGPTGDCDDRDGRAAGGTEAASDSGCRGAQRAETRHREVGRAPVSVGGFRPLRMLECSVATMKSNSPNRLIG